MSLLTAPRPRRASRRYLDRPRWFGGKGRDFAVTDVRRVGALAGAADDRAVVHRRSSTVALRRRRARPSSTRCRWRYYAEPSRSGSTHALVGWWDDAELGCGARLRRAARPRGDGAAGCARSPTPPRAPTARRRADVPPAARPRARPRRRTRRCSRGEQCNSSVAFGEDALMKVFRKVTPGRQPRHRGPRGADPSRAASTSPRSTAGSSADGDGADEPVQLGDAAAVPAHRQRRLGPRAGQRPRPVRRGRPARRRGRRRLRRRGRAARRGDRARCTPSLRRALPDRARCGRRASCARSPTAMRDPARRRARASCPSWRSTPTALRATFDAARRRSTEPSPSSGCTATSTSARRCAPSRAGRSSTSRASRPSRSPSGVAARLAVARRRRHAALLRLRRRTPSSARRPGRRRGAPAARLPRRRVGRPQPRRLPRGYADAAGAPDEPTAQVLLRRLRGRQGGLRGGLRGPQPPDLAADPARRDRRLARPRRDMTPEANSA